MRRLKDQILAMGIATILVLYASSLAIPALTPVAAFATTDDDTNDDVNNDVLLFLIDVVQCFTDNDEEFSDDVQLCLYAVIDEYFNEDNFNDNNDSQDNDISSNDNNNNGTSSQET
jgi:hypothetical protein